MTILLGNETLVLTLTNVTGDPDITLSATPADLTAQTANFLIMMSATISITTWRKLQRRCWYSKLCCNMSNPSSTDTVVTL